MYWRRSATSRTRRPSFRRASGKSSLRYSSTDNAICLVLASIDHPAANDVRVIKSGSEQESVRRTVLVRDFILNARQDEGEGLDESAGLAGISGLPQRNQRSRQNAEVVGAAQA